MPDIPVTNATNPPPAPPQRPEPAAPSTSLPPTAADDELYRAAKRLGVKFDRETPREDLQRRVNELQITLNRLDRDALLDIVKWARVPVRQSSSKEQLAGEIADIHKVDYESLSERGARALAALRGLGNAANQPREEIIRALHKAETIATWFKRKRRAVTARLLSRLIDTEDAQSEYRFLPEDSGDKPTLRQEIEGRGLMGSLANRLRGAADDYVKDKLDEIEQRIDRKLDEIDQRLGEWRDREVANRLRIIRITLVASVLVAGMSLVYKYVSQRVAGPAVVSPMQGAPQPGGQR